MGRPRVTPEHFKNQILMKTTYQKWKKNSFFFSIKGFSLETRNNWHLKQKKKLFQICIFIESTAALYILFVEIIISTYRNKYEIFSFGAEVGIGEHTFDLL